jgi:hypothetical protein
VATTPECLQKQFGIAAELGTVSVPRIIYAFDGINPGDRSAFQSAYLPAVMSGAIAFEGQHGYTVKGIRKGVTQATMAEHAGTRRETVSQRISKLSAPAKARTARQQWLRARSLRNTNLAKSELHKLMCEPCAAGCLCKEGAQLEARANMRVGDESDYEFQLARSATAPIFGRRRRFGMASRYDLNVIPRRELPAIFEAESGIECKRFFDPAKAEVSCEKMNQDARERGSFTRYIVGTVEVDPKRFVYPTIEQLCGDPGGGLAWFDANFKKHGFKPYSRWVWDPKLRDPDTGRRLGTTARKVMSLYESMGLLEDLRDNSGKVTSAKGYLESKQDGIADALGIDVRTLYTANCKWEKMCVLRISGGNPRETAEGIRRGKMLVIYLPFKQLTEEEAALELARVAARVREIVAKEGAQRLLQLREAQRLNTELVNAWKGREHCMGALWREWARQMTAARIYPDLIDKLVPPLRPQELNEAWFDTKT